MPKSYRSVLTWGMLLLVLALFGCIATQNQKTVTPEPTVRSANWTQTALAEFETGQVDGLQVTDVAGGELRLLGEEMTGVYTSTIVTTEFSFNAIVAHWNATVPRGSELRVELRFETKTVGWSAWHPVDDAMWVFEKEQFYPETPLLLSNGQQFQYRATFTTVSDADPPLLSELTITYMDTAAGPTTVQAKMRTRVEAATAQGVPAPAIITRAGWGADESYRTWDPEYRPVHKIVVHHTVTTNDYDEAQGAAWVRAIYYYHAVTLGWGDIGYNYLVDKYGNLYEGRYGGPGVVGGHVYSFNYGTMGVAVIGVYGNYSNSIEPTANTLASLANLSVWEANRSTIHPFKEALFRDVMIPNLGGHRDYPPYSTSCPGDLLYAELSALRQSVWDLMREYIPRYDVEWLTWQDLPSLSLEAGHTYTLDLSVRNLGWFEWLQDGGNPVRLGYHWLDENGTPVVQPPEHDHRTPLAQPMAFGDVYDFQSVPVTTPDSPGNYTLVWDMVHEGVTWFHDANPSSGVLEQSVTIVVPPTPTSTPTPTVDLRTIKNGDFEYNGVWMIYETSHPARYVDQLYHNGTRALQTGIVDLVNNVYSYSSAEQRFMVPMTGNRGLVYWYQAQIADGDYAYVYLRPEGSAWQILEIVRKNVSGWTQSNHDLSSYAGQMVTLRFGTFNDGRDGVSVMYVDDVKISVEKVPVPTSTPTATLTPTATSTPTMTPPPTVTPTATPAPTTEACSELVVNGDFETNGGWLIANTPYKARYTDTVARSGARSLQLGMESGEDNRFSYSSVEQQFDIPTGAKATLAFWYQMPNQGGNGDYGYFLIRPEGGTWRVLRIVRDRAAEWTKLEVDVSHYAGEMFILRLGMRNDGGEDNASAVMYVDSLSVLACRP
ncbi:MAG: N-acetylmuramoyl-L-alanine amidase [Anaerolineae bacterium]|nr:N-acetylmuramoyl-L-alanine amidase [Anaerolineae bacterium]